MRGYLTVLDATFCPIMTLDEFLAFTTIELEPFFNLYLHVTVDLPTAHLTVFFVAPLNDMLYVRAPVTFLKVPCKVFVEAMYFHFTLMLGYVT